MNKKISQFEVTTSFEDNDILTLVQDKTNKIIHKDDFETSLSGTFATNERVDGIEEDVANLDTKVDNNYVDLSNKIVEGDTNVTNNLSSNINSYYDVLNNKIITLEDKHDKDLTEVNDTVQGWIDTIDDKSTKEQLQNLLNRLIEDENIITALADLIANGGGSGEAPGFHTQPTSTIFPLSGYYKGSDASPLATSDTLNQALSKLENQVEAISSSSGSLPVIKTGESTLPTDNNIYTAGKVKEDYLRKDGDTATGYTTFLQGIQAGQIFRSGWDGQGASLYPVNSKWNFEIDNLFVRGNMTVNELTVNEIKAVGGDILVTLADMECTEVVVTDNAYRCYFDDGDGTKYNSFQVNDMAICQKFDGKNVKRYWRKVNAVGKNYIDLSMDVCESGSGIPEAEDKILQLGHMYESDPTLNAEMDERRNAIFISAKGDNAPRISYYKNIDDFTLADSDGVVRERVVIGGEQTKFVGTIYQTSDTGIIRVPVYKGVWIAGTTYRYYDQVTHNGSTWICMNPNGTTTEPSESEDDWQLYISKGDSGKPGDDAAKWVEITGDRLFLYDGPDFSGIPNPAQLALNANVYGMTNPTYKWELMTETPLEISIQKSAQINYYEIPETYRTILIKCTVTDSDGSTYYDEVQLAKLCNGAEGLDAYYIDLSNGTAVIPYDYSGISKVPLSSIYTDVYAYKGINPVPILDITTSVVGGNATVTVSNSRVILETLNSSTAQIQLSVTVQDGVTITKMWYIGKAVDGEPGFDGTDASYVYMSGEQFFHYSSGATVPTPTSIVLTTDTFNILNPQYTWYWSPSGVYEWQEILNETTNKLTVSYNATYFTNYDEVTFKCTVSTQDGAVSYSDFLTINNVYDGEDVYRARLTNECAGVVADSNGTVTDYSTAVTESSLRYGSQDITDYKLSPSLEVGRGTVTYDNANKTLKCTSLSTDQAMWKVKFIYPENSNNVVDTVDFVVLKQKQGENGAAGSNQIMIFTNTNNTPSKPTFSTRPSNGSISGGYSWYLDPTNSTTTLTWVSSGQYDPDSGGMKYDSDLGGYWTKPVIYSPLNGAQGDSVTSVTAYYYKSTSQTSLSGGSWSTSRPTASNGYYIWQFLRVYFSDGSYSDTPYVCLSGSDGAAGDNGPALNFRGDYSSSKTYGWTTNPNVRDVVYRNSTYYMVSENRKGSTFSNVTPPNSSYWTAFNTFENIATGLLFADKATIAGWQFSNYKIYSTNNQVVLNGNSVLEDAASGTDTDIVFAAGGTLNPAWDGSKINKLAGLKIHRGGTLTVGNGATESRAGLTGSPDMNSLRIWAGAIFSNRNDAPFRVYDDGSMVATNGTFTGKVTCTSLIADDISSSNFSIPGLKCAGRCNWTGSSASFGYLFTTRDIRMTVSRIATGRFRFTLTGSASTDYIVLCSIDNPTTNISSGFRGSYQIGPKYTNQFDIHWFDTDGSAHDLTYFNVAFFSY